MISQEIYEYLTSSADSSSYTDYAKLSGLIISKGIMVQILSDGMLIFHDLGEQKLLRVMI